MEVKAVCGVDDDRPVPGSRATQGSAPEEAGDRGVEVDDVVALPGDQLAHLPQVPERIAQLQGVAGPLDRPGVVERGLALAEGGIRLREGVHAPALLPVVLGIREQEVPDHVVDRRDDEQARRLRAHAAGASACCRKKPATRIASDSETRGWSGRLTSCREASSARGHWPSA